MFLRVFLANKAHYSFIIGLSVYLIVVLVIFRRTRLAFTTGVYFSTLPCEPRLVNAGTAVTGSQSGDLNTDIICIGIDVCF